MTRYHTRPSPSLRQDTERIVMQLVRAALCALTAASLAAAWSWTPSTFRGARVWARDNHSATKRNIASFKNKFGYKDERYKRDLVHPLMFTRETRWGQHQSNSNSI